MKKFLSLILVVFIAGIFTSTAYGLSNDGCERCKKEKPKKQLKQKKDKKQDVRKKLKKEAEKRFKRLPEGRQRQMRGRFERFRDALRKRIANAIAERLGQLDDEKIHWILSEHIKRHPHCKFKALGSRIHQAIGKRQQRGRQGQRFLPKMPRQKFKAHPDAKARVKIMTHKRCEMKCCKCRAYPYAKSRVKKMVPKSCEMKCPKCKEMQAQKDKKPTKSKRKHPRSIIV